MNIQKTTHTSWDTWLHDRIQYISGLKSPTAHQSKLLELHAKSDLSKPDLNLLSALFKAERLSERHENALAAISAAQNPQTAADRALETRKKTIVGGWLLANEPKTFERVVSKLTRKQDRELFGLADSEKPLASVPDFGSNYSDQPKSDSFETQVNILPHQNASSY